MKMLQEQDILDDLGMTKFETLHDMQVNSCIAFSDNELFGTFVPAEGEEGGEYEWMTYTEFGKKVEQSRAVLKEMGT